MVISLRCVAAALQSGGFRVIRKLETTVSEASAALAAIEAGDAEKLRALLRENPALASARDSDGVSVIMKALYRRRPDMLDALLTAAPELDIFEATATGRTERVAELLRQDPALANRCSADGFTALHFACFFSQEGVAHLLLEHGADVSGVARNPMKVMPLHSAATARNLAIVRLLLEHGAPPNAPQQQGWTALHAAAQNGDTRMVELLLQHGAERTLRNDDGITAADLARKHGHAEILALLP
jgi:ankyrin repeat protein